MSVPTTKTQSYFPLAGAASDGWSTPDAATATCFCGSVQLSFPTSGPGFLGTFVCHCTDCRKITASMFASNFIIGDSHLTHIRGQENLSEYAQSKTIASGKAMTNFFCRTCGSLMYRVGESFPGVRILRVGTVDDFALHEGVLKPQREIYADCRVGWLKEVEGVKQFGGQTPRAKV